jgi:hypothetical protein
LPAQVPSSYRTAMRITEGPSGERSASIVPFGSILASRRPVMRESARQNTSVRVHRSPSARCASRHRFLRWRRTRPPFAVSGEFRRHRRLSLDLPASLETQTRRPREVFLPLPSPQTARPGRSRCSASRLPFPSRAARQAALPATLSCVSNGRCSRSTAIR